MVGQRSHRVSAQSFDVDDAATFAGAAGWCSDRVRRRHTAMIAADIRRRLNGDQLYGRVGGGRFALAHGWQLQTGWQSTHEQQLMGELVGVWVCVCLYGCV